MEALVLQQEQEVLPRGLLKDQQTMGRELHFGAETESEWWGKTHHH